MEDNRFPLLEANIRKRLNPKRAQEVIDTLRNTRIVGEIHNNPRLSSCFIFAGTVQGHHFWQSIADEIRLQKEYNLAA